MCALFLQRTFHYVEDTQLLNTLRYSYEMRTFCGLGIVRHLEMHDEDFREQHPELPREPHTNSPEIDKEIGDSTALKPVLLYFRKTHPALRYGVFSSDAACDSYVNYSFLLNEYNFNKAVIPINPRNSKDSANNAFDENRTPLCPVDGTPFIYRGKVGGKNRSLRLKYGCP